MGRTGGPTGSLAPLRHEEFRRLWLVGVIGHLGTYLQLTAGPWLMFVMTGSPLLVSLTTSALFLPRLALTIPAGALSDRFDRRRVLAFGYLVSATSAAALAFLTAADRLTPDLLLALTFGLGCGAAIIKPAQLTYIPDLVPPLLRTQAITLNSASHQVARIVGPSIGGAVVAIGRAEAAFLANAVALLLVLIAVQRAPDVDSRAGVVGDEATRSLGVFAGLSFLRESRVVRDLIVFSAFFTLFAVGLQAVLPNIVAEILDLGPRGFGVMYGMYGAGALFGAATRQAAARLSRGRLVGVSMLLYGAAMVGVVILPYAAFAMFMMLIAGAGWVWTLTTLNAGVQLQTPPAIRGRVIAVFVLAVGMKPIGAALVGLIAEFVGLVEGVIAGGIGTMLVGLMAYRSMAFSFDATQAGRGDRPEEPSMRRIRSE